VQTSVRIDAGNNAPSVTVLSPIATTRFRVGQPLKLRASAVDGNGQTLPDRRSAGPHSCTTTPTRTRI